MQVLAAGGGTRWIGRISWVMADLRQRKTYPIEPSPLYAGRGSARRRLDPAPATYSDN